MGQGNGMAFDILARDKAHFTKIRQEILNKISKFLETYTISTGTEQEVFPTKVFGVKTERSFSNSTKKTKLDNVDLKILELLSHNSRIEYKEISKKLNLTANAIKHRIKNLEKSKIILGYTISVDLRKLNYEWYNVQLKVTNHQKESLLRNFLRNHPKVTYFYNHFGHENWDVDVGVIARDSIGLRDFIFELRKDFGDILKIHDIYILVEESKPNQAPKGIFKQTGEIKNEKVQ